MHPAVPGPGGAAQGRLPVATDEDGYGLGGDRRHLDGGYVIDLPVEFAVPAGEKTPDDGDRLVHALPRPSQGTSSSR